MSEEEDAAAILSACEAGKARYKAIKDGIGTMDAAEKSNCRAALSLAAVYVDNAASQGGIA